MHDLIGH